MEASGCWHAPLCPTYEACVVFDGFPPTQVSPVIPAKAGIHNGAPIMKQPAVYIMTYKAKGTLYTNVTSNLKNRVWNHREDQVEGFTQRYAVHQLVYYELHEEMIEVIVREKRLKKWNRAWKNRLIHGKEPRVE